MAAGAALCMCAAMTGCGGGSSGSSSKEMAMSDVFSQSGTHVWYRCNQNEHVATKETKISYYILIEDGTITAYDVPNQDDYDDDDTYYAAYDLFWDSQLTLGDVAGMTDDEVISHMKETAIARSVDGMELSVITDGSGNEVIAERIGGDSEISSKSEYQPIAESFQIFDAYYDGYVYESTYRRDTTRGVVEESEYKYLITKTDNKIDYVLNKVGDDGVTAE